MAWPMLATQKSVTIPPTLLGVSLRQVPLAQGKKEREARGGRRYISRFVWPHDPWSSHCLGHGRSNGRILPGGMRRFGRLEKRIQTRGSSRPFTALCSPYIKKKKRKRSIPLSSGVSRATLSLWRCVRRVNLTVKSSEERGEDCWRNFFFIQFEDWIVASKEGFEYLGDGGGGGSLDWYSAS